MVTHPNTASRGISTSTRFSSQGAPSHLREMGQADCVKICMTLQVGEFECAHIPNLATSCASAGEKWHVREGS